MKKNAIAYFVAIVSWCHSGMLNAVVGGSMGVCLFSLAVSLELDCRVPVECFAALPDVARS